MAIRLKAVDRGGGWGWGGGGGGGGRESILAIYTSVHNNYYCKGK